AQARAFADFLGGEEWLEDPVNDFRGNATAGIPDAQGDIAAGGGTQDAFRRTFVQGDILRFDENGSPLLHGVTGIHTKIEQNLVKLRRIAFDRGEVAGVSRADGNGFRKG